MDRSKSRVSNVAAAYFQTTKQAESTRLQKCSSLKQLSEDALQQMDVLQDHDTNIPRTAE